LHSGFSVHFFYLRAACCCSRFSSLFQYIHYMFLPNGHLQYKAAVKVKVILRPTVNRPVRLGVRHLSGTRDQFFFLLKIFFRQLRVCYFVVTSPTRGRVCNLLLLLVHILLSKFLSLPQPRQPFPRIYIPQERSGPDIPPGTGFPFRRSYDSQGYGEDILSRLYAGRQLLLSRVIL
jgi:hypothetical protein